MKGLLDRPKFWACFVTAASGITYLAGVASIKNKTLRRTLSAMAGFMFGQFIVELVRKEEAED